MNSLHPLQHGTELRLVNLKNIHAVLEENEMEAWQKLIRVLTHEIMNSIAPIISLSETLSERAVQQYLFGENVDNGTRERLINQFKTILDGRSDIRNLGIIGSNGRKLINDGKQSVNPDLKLSTQEWYLEALQKPEGPLLTSSHVQHIIRSAEIST